MLWLVILLTITISGLTDGIEIHIVVAGYIVDHHCLMFDRGVVHVVVAGYIVHHCCLRSDRGVVHIDVAGHIVDHYCLRFDRGVVHIVVLVILFTITARCLTEEWFMLLWLVILLTITV